MQPVTKQIVLKKYGNTAMMSNGCMEMAIVNLQQHLAIQHTDMM